MFERVCLITGGNSGIGKQAAIQLAQIGFHVIADVRSLKRGEVALAEIREKSGKKDVELLQIDLSSKKSIIDASNGLKNSREKLDVLIHNAADFDISRKRPEKSVDGMESIWATNHIGPVLLTNSVMDLIKKRKYRCSHGINDEVP